MFLFLLPYSSLQKRLSLKECDKGRFVFGEFEPIARSIERGLVGDSSLAPAYQRFGGSFWESLELWALPPKVANYIEENAWVLSPVYGLLKPSSCIPYAPISWSTFYNGGKLLHFWREHYKNVPHRLFSNKVVLPFCGGLYAKLFNLRSAERVVRFDYYRKETKVKNPLKHYAYTLRYIAEKGLSLSDLYRINFYDYRVESIKEIGKDILVVMRSEGKYEL